MKMNCEIIGKISGIYKGEIQYCTLQEEHGGHLMKQVPLLYKQRPVVHITNAVFAVCIKMSASVCHH